MTVDIYTTLCQLLISALFAYVYHQFLPFFQLQKIIDSKQYALTELVKVRGWQDSVATLLMVPTQSRYKATEPPPMCTFTLEEVSAPYSNLWLASLVLNGHDL